MARTLKKETVLTAGEKLAHAVMPEAEQPYQVPQNWCWITVGSVLTLQAGKNISSSLIADVKDIDHPYLCFGGNGIRGYVPTFNRDGQFPIIGRQGALCGNLNWADGQFYATEHAVVVECPEFVDKKWAYYILDYMNLNQYATATAQPGLAVGNILKLPLSLPPIAEQQRIVDRIESLFAKLDEAKEKAQAVVDGYDARRAAILHKAFTGELTTEWRRKNNVSLESWKQCSIAEICHSLKYGTAKKSKDSGPVVVIRMGNLQSGEIDWSDLAFTDDEEDIAKYKLTPGDVLFNRTNSAALVGKTSIYRGDYPAIYAGYLIKLDYDHDVIIGDYLNYALNTHEAKQYCNSVKSDGVNQSNINAKKIGAYVIPVPSIKEQERIVELVKRLLEKELKAKETSEQVIDQVDTMKKSILARAFRGELGTNDPNDESAIELLKRVP